MIKCLSLLIVLLIGNSISIGQCGPENYLPTSPDDCISFSNTTHACCLLDMENAPVEYKICFAMELTDVTPIISIGKIVYRIKCDGLANYYTLFPLEGQYKACGVQNPSILSDCWSHNSEEERCCMVGNTKDLLPTENPMCYYFPPNEFTIENFTVTSKTGNQMFVGCNSDYIKVSISSAMSLIYLLCLL